MTYSVWSRLHMVKTRPPAMLGVLKPSPSPVAFQASFGPFFGQVCNRPVSRDRAVRSGPCHCGQSNFFGSLFFPFGTARAAVATKNRERHQAQRSRMRHLLLGNRSRTGVG